MFNVIFALTLALFLVLIIVNQYGEVISSKVQVIVIGGHAYLYNQTHWIIESNLSEVIVKVYRLNICVGEFKIKMGKVYRLKVLVSHMIIQTPKTIILKIYLLGTNHTWTLTGKTSYILENMPHATYKIEILGINFEKIVYWESGVISIGKKYEININLIMKIIPFAVVPPLATSLALRRGRKRRVKRDKIKIRMSKKSGNSIRLSEKKHFRRPKTLVDAILSTET